MRILLIEPPYERFIGFKSEWFPMGISCMASYLIERGHDVAVYHAEHGPDTEYKSVVKYAENFGGYKAAVEADDHPIWAEVIREISLFHPDVVGVSVLTPKVPSAFKIAAICKKIDPKMIVVFGNHHSTIRPAEMLSDRNVDFVVRGEGEETLSLLVDNLAGSSPDHHAIAGLSFRNNGKIVNNRDRTRIKNLDDLPFPARNKLLHFNTYTSVQLDMVMTSRGCPYSCAFCASHNMWGKKVRFRSIGNIIDEINELKNMYSMKNITFMDDSFTINKERVKELCQAMIEKNINITWSCLTRVNMINDEIIALMKKAGCAKVDVGIESGNQRVLDLINKGITVQQVRKAAEILRRNKMYWSGFFMFGFPTETEREIFDTLNFLKELKPNWANISIFTPYPGTDLYQLSVEKGLVTEPPDYTLYSHQNSDLRFTDIIPRERFSVLARNMLAEVHKYNSRSMSLLKRALTRKYYSNPTLLLQDAKKLITWIKK